MWREKTRNDSSVMEDEAERQKAENNVKHTLKMWYLKNKTRKNDTKTRGFIRHGTQGKKYRQKYIYIYKEKWQIWKKINQKLIINAWNSYLNQHIFTFRPKLWLLNVQSHRKKKQTCWCSDILLSFISAVFLHRPDKTHPDITTRQHRKKTHFS